MKATLLKKHLIWLAALGIGAQLVCASAFADEETEVVRLRGFAEHQSEEKQFDRLRRRGETEYLEEAEQWERQKDKDLADYKKRKAQDVKNQSDKSVGAKEDAQEKLAWDREYDKNRQAYLKKQKGFDRSKFKDLVTESEELDLASNRPRYDYKKRALYGAPLKYGKAGPSTSSSSGGGFTPPAPAPFGTAPSFPPTPAYDDFGDGYIPPPTLGDGFGDDLPPPPPPPPPPMDEFNQDFPPPPPPPPFMDDMGGF